MLFDLHNDLITSGLDASGMREAAKGYSHALRGAVLVFWSSKSTGLPPQADMPKGKNLYFAVEDLYFFTPDNDDELLRYSPVYCSLTWNYDNALAGGAYGDGGLTELGRETVEFLNKNKIAVDAAHLNRKSFYEVAERAERFIDSHTFISDLFKHPRNISFSMIDIIVRGGGLVGLTPVRSFMGNNADLNSYVRGIDVFLQRFGDDNLCIGTDFNGSVDFPYELKSYDGFRQVEEYLLKSGYSNKTVDKIFYKNAVKFFALGER